MKRAIKKEKVLKMKPGRRIDFLVAQKVMGEKLHSFDNSAPSETYLKQNREMPHYSTNANFAEKVLEKMRRKYPTVLLGTTSWECEVFMPTGVVTSGSCGSLSLAICKAALLTVIEEGIQDRIRECGPKQKLKLFLKGKFRYAKEG